MKIILNCLPPTDINSPSISLSILKSFMEKNGIETELKYWNFILSLMSEYTDVEDTEIRMLPFLSMLNDMEANEKGNQRIISKLQHLDPSHKAIDFEYYKDFLHDKKEEIVAIIHQEIETIDFNEVLIFGISAKYNQWLPGIILAQEVKKIAPHVKIIIGGFGDDASAKEALKHNANFDFATWGEGEYPLLLLAQELQKTSPDYTTVPRLFYRNNNNLCKSITQKSEYLDFENYLYPNYDDFVNNHPNMEDNDQISIPINTIRSCHWSKCKFCDFNKGYRLRERSPQCVVNEIEHITNEYGISTFSFVDSDTFGNEAHFEELLDRIISLKNKNEADYVFWSEIIPNAQFNKKLMQKMAIAGFKNVFIGYDGLSDNMLSKMNKSNDFADNIFFVKESIANGINPMVNVIKHIPGETEADIHECTNNLHFLRFFYNDPLVCFHHTYVSLVLSSMTKYYAQMTSDELLHYNVDDYSYFLPERFSNNDDRFHLFRYERDVALNKKEWDKLIAIEDYYKTNTFSYKIQENEGVLYFTEYCNELEIANLTFEEAEYAFVLKATQYKVCNFNQLFEQASKQFNHLTKDGLIEVLNNLKASYLLYYKNDLSSIISLISL